MSEIDAVAEVIWRESLSLTEAEQWKFDENSEDIKRHYRRAAQAVINVLRPTITTVEQLEALPDGSVVVGADDAVWERFNDNDMASVYGPWVTTGYDVAGATDEIELPALVLWTVVDRG